MKAMLILIHSTIDMREKAMHKNDFTDVQVFVGFSGVNRLSLEKFEPKSGTVRGAMFTDKETFKEALQSVDTVVKKMNNDNGGCRCTSALEIEFKDAILGHAAEERLEQNEDE